MIYQCLRGASLAEIEAAGLMAITPCMTTGLFRQTLTACLSRRAISSARAPDSDLVEDLAAEQKARATYEHLMTLTDNPELLNPLRFLREREIVHFQRFGECLEIVQALQSGETRIYYPSVSMRGGMNYRNR